VTCACDTTTSHQRHAFIRSLSNVSISDSAVCQRATAAFYSTSATRNMQR